MYKAIKKQIEIQNFKDEIRLVQKEEFYHDILDKQLQLAEPRVGSNRILTFIVADNSDDMR